MKKILVISVAVMLSLMLVGSVFAAGKTVGQAKRNTGCGLGAMLFQNSADDSILLQVFQMTTNHSISPQSFSITTGTFDCEQPAKFVNNEKAYEFAIANFDNLAKDIASGSGETIETLAEIMQIPSKDKVVFYQKLQTNFSTIFPSENVVLADALDAIAIVASN